MTIILLRNYKKFGHELTKFISIFHVDTYRTKVTMLLMYLWKHVDMFVLIKDLDFNIKNIFEVSMEKFFGTKLNLKLVIVNS